MARVELRGIGKSYGTVVAVRDVDLAIEDGELMVLVGPSGCGKTTTLRMIAGLEDITTGDLLIGDRRVNQVHPKDRDIAMVFQSYALYPHMTVRENMAFGLRLRGLPRQEIEDRVRQAATMLGIADYLDRKPRALSGGQRQRVAMGRAIVRQPAVFLFDEPLSNLDAKFRVTMRVELKRLQRTLRTTTVYVTHDQTEAMTLADRIAVMEGGRVRQVGSPREVFDTPADRFVGGFIGSPAMNFLAARIESGGNGPTFRTTAATIPVPGALAVALEPFRDQSVTLGIRPGDLHVAAEGTPGSLRGRVEVVEHMGYEKFAYVAAPEGSLTLRLEPDVPVREGEAVSLVPRPDRIHVFGGPEEHNLIPVNRP
ncbi:MAG TPA: sn-glycerol-3-phosphate ABC transporter ATP-binding protein UgpC [Myxococcota bacterium]|nr:sn-glycerol-3-phosphate ABC transporter ATP-binding protein UgpC [Myxococcota bacterium]HQK49815.1 sn-glycerol-3-phosphate ABC transporter ATP-binding protein UgpC [Myxococcota bacterium]